jgi:hypothetical protein
MKNKWVSSDETFVSWTFELKPVKDDTDIRNVITFVRQLLEIGINREIVFYEFEWRC